MSRPSVHVQNYKTEVRKRGEKKVFTTRCIKRVSMDLPTDFFNRESILSLTGATAVVYVVTAASQHAFKL